MSIKGAAKFLVFTETSWLKKMGIINRFSLVSFRFLTQPHTLEPDGVVDEVQHISNCIVFTDFHFLSLC